MDKKVKRATLLFIVYLILTTTVYGIVKMLVTIPTTGFVEPLKLDANPSSIEWGNFSLNDPQIQTVTLTNNENLPISNLTMNYTLPSGFTGTLTWNYTDQTLAVGEFVVVEFNLTITSGEGDFAFDINIEGDV